MNYLTKIYSQENLFTERKSMNDTFDPRKIETSQDQFKEIIGAINRHYCELTITAVNGNCPYGHKAGEKHDVSAMNTSSLCGALYTSIQHSIFALDYGGSFPLQKPNSFNALCTEMGNV